MALWGIDSRTTVLVLSYSMRRSMDLHMDAHRLIPIRRPGAEPRTDLIERAGLPWGPARRGNWTASASRRTGSRAPSRIFSGAGTGRCMRASPRRSPRRSRGRAPPQGTTCETEKRKSSGAASPQWRRTCHDARYGGDVGARRVAGGLAGWLPHESRRLRATVGHSPRCSSGASWEAGSPGYWRSLPTRA